MSWNEMNRLEERLREALRRRQPPEGFADRVMERIRQDSGTERPPEVLSWRPQRPARGIWFRVAAIAACVAVVTGGLVQYQREQHAQRRANAEKAFAALQLTADKLHSVRAHIVNAGANKKGREE